MHLIVGLGNPGREYEKTRHNVGFVAIDYLASQLGIKMGKLKFKAICGEGFIGNEKCILMKPQTFMNLSGESVRDAAEFYKIAPEDIIVMYDDVNLETGKVRIRPSGSAGGHNGIKSIIQHLGSDNFPRIKLGVGEKPHPDFDLADYVLSGFTKDEIPQMKQAMEKACKALELLTNGKIDEAMSKFSH